MPDSTDLVVRAGDLMPASLASSSRAWGVFVLDQRAAITPAGRQVLVEAGLALAAE